MADIFRARTLFVLSALFIVYLTSIPWDFDHAPSLANVQWIPLWDTERGRIHSLPDLVQNVLLFLPFGFFGVLAARGRIASIVGAGLLLSIFVEILQTTSATRTPSASDVVMNTFGTLLGAIGARIYAGRLAQRIRRVVMDLVGGQPHGEPLRSLAAPRPGLLVLGAYAAALALGGLAPFVPSLDVSDLRANIRGLIDDPWGPKPPGALAADVLLFAALGFLAAREIRFGFLAAAGLGVAIELAQLVIVDHSPKVQDAAAAVVGAALGALLAFLLERGRPKPAAEVAELSKRRPVLVIGFAILGPLLRALSPFVLAPLREKLAAISGWSFVPFWELFKNVNLSTLRNVFEAAAFYIPLGYALFAIRVRPLILFALALLLADVLEILQIPIADRTFDITEGIYAGCGALVGAYALLVLSRFQVASARTEPEPTDGDRDRTRRAESG